MAGSPSRLPGRDKVPDTGAAAVVHVSIRIRGNVQGVGFRPFILRLARRYGLSGSVANTPSGVEIIAQGGEAAIEEFYQTIPQEKPPHAIIDHLDRRNLTSPTSKEKFSSFQIIASADHGPYHITPPPDMDLCARCREELFDPHNHRHRYPFISCTDCGPRYTMIHNLPFDRAKTAMASFPPCPSCAEEYHDPANRRFHAQAICCPACGPEYFLADREGRMRTTADPIIDTIDLLRQGKIIAIKGIGGFHLVVDANNHPAVQELRQRKKRPDKPLAIMAKDLQTIQNVAQLNETEVKLLTGHDKPIVLLEKNNNFPLATNIAANNKRIGVMLPYTPLHHLLLAEKNLPTLVMTSGNRSGEPIIFNNQIAMAQLADIADFFLCHNRDIINSCDDSVLLCQNHTTTVLRNSRGLTPATISLNHDCGRTLALGGNDKNSICLTRNNQAFLSQHIGNLDHVATYQRFEEISSHLQTLLQIEPELIVHDLHPDYQTSRYALTKGSLATVAVQHHHAHAVSCMAEHRLNGPVLAITLDGSGYGPDQTIWGGEILLARHDSYQRLAHLQQIAMPGGEQAVREPWRMGFSYLSQAYGDVDIAKDLPCFRDRQENLPTIMTMIKKKINSPLTSSCGRLFDGIAALLNLCPITSFDGQAAMALEAIATNNATTSYPMEIMAAADGVRQLMTTPIIRGVVTDLKQGVTKENISSRFHLSLADLFTTGCRQLREEHDLTTVVCSGGVFQNSLFTSLLRERLAADGFTVYTHQTVPTNDGGLSLGQAVAGRAIHRKTSAQESREESKP